MQYVKIASTLYSFRREVGVVIGVLAAIIILPIFAVIGLLNNGVQGASDALVSIDPVTHKVEVRDAKGALITTMDATTTWPIKGTVTQEFGVPNPPYQVAHSGIDISGGFGTLITVFMQGKVIKVGNALADAVRTVSLWTMASALPQCMPTCPRTGYKSAKRLNPVMLLGLKAKKDGRMALTCILRSRSPTSLLTHVYL